MPRYSEEAKEREIKTRAMLGPRLGHPKPGGHRVTAPARVPRATGAPGPAMRGAEGQDAD